MSSNISIEEIIKKVKEEAKKQEEKEVTHEGGFDFKIEPSIKIINKKSLPFEHKEIYEYSDFTKYNDIEFIQYIYKGLLLREADSEGLNHYLSLLRSGKKSKSEIISLIRFSQEGKEKNIKLLGAKKRYIISIIYNLPFISYFFKSIEVLFTLPKIKERLNRNENYTSQVEHLCRYNDFQLEKEINKSKKNLIKLNEIKENKDTFINFKAFITKKVNRKVEQDKFEEALSSLRRNFGLHNKKINQLSNKVINIENKKKNTINKDTLDLFYLKFENKFRGSRKDIKQRVSIYLPYLQELPYNKENINILDIGCGRGEWLELLKENGYRAKGIDINTLMVDKAKDFNLDVEERDVIEYLKQQKDNSITVITGFHVIEHLTFDTLIKLFEESYRVLKKGGMIIFETPNPENILVGSQFFYSDPTHINPLVPNTVKFIIEFFSFNNIEIKRLHKYSDYYELTAEDEDNFMSKLLYNEMDFAVIGYK